MATFDYLAAASLTGAFFAGMTPMIWKNLQQAWAKRMGVEEARIAVNARELIGMMAVGVVLGGLAIDQWGARNALFGGSFGMALGMAMLAVSASLSAGRAAGLVIGAGGGCLLNAAVNFMPDTFAMDSYAADLNLGFIFVGFGYLSVGPVTRWLVRKVSFRHGLLVFSLLCTIPAVIVTLTPAEMFHAPAPPMHIASVLASPDLWMAAGFAVLFAPQVEAVRSWGSAYLSEIGYGSRSLVILTAGFWLGFLAARLIFGLILDPRFEFWLLMALVICAAATLGHLWSGYTAASGTGYLLLGFLYGPIFPTILGIVFSRFTGGRAMAFGVVYAVGALSTMIAAPFMARAAGQKARPHIRTSMLLLLLAWIPILALAFWHAQ